MKIMKPILQTLVVCLLLTLPGISQTAHKPTTNSPPAPKNLSDTFAKSALRALFTVNRDYLAFDDPGTPGFEMSREAHKAVSDLDADATTKQEQEVVSTLSGYDLQKDLNNLARKAVYSMAEVYLIRHPMDGRELLKRVTALKTMDDTENACSTSLEAALRQRSWHTLPACSNDALTVEVSNNPEELFAPAKQ